MASGVRALLAGCAALCVLGGSAFALAPAPPEPERTVSLTLAPALLVHPVVQLGAELRVHRQAGVSLIGGYGAADEEVKAADGTRSTASRTVWTAGAQGRYYGLGHFDHGLQIGFEALYTGVTGGASRGPITVSRAGEGLSLGPFIGYKITTLLGLTFEGQLGIKRAGIAGPNSAMSQWVPLLNGNVGWSL